MAKQTIKQKPHAKNIHMRDQKKRSRHLGACYDHHCMDDVVFDVDAIAPMRGAVVAITIVAVVAVVTVVLFSFFSVQDKTETISIIKK